MRDPRFDQLAELLVGYSTKLRPGEKVLLDAYDIPPEMTVALIRAVRGAKALPFVQTHQARVVREMAREASEAQYQFAAEHELARMKKMDAYIAVRGSENITEMSDVPGEKMKLAMKIMRPVIDWRVKKTRWCVLRWPTPSMAQQAGMSTEQFENFYFNVCTLDYARMVPGMKALKALMEKTDRVEIKGPGTDLQFSIRGIPAITCGGSHNIPDGEVFTAPVKNSVQGHVTFNAPTIYQGTAFDSIRLAFKDGKVVDATANNSKKLNEILDSDAGARFIGEFSLAFNPHILHPMRDILFDEKISGSFHFTPGQAYEQADNGNRVASALGHGLHPAPGLWRRHHFVRRKSHPPRRTFRPQAASALESGPLAMKNVLAENLTQDEAAQSFIPKRAMMPPLGSERWKSAAESAMVQSWMEPIRALATKEIGESLPALTDELYREFFTSGNRLPFEDAYFERRRRFARAAMCALIDGGRNWLDSMRDKLAQISEEVSWALPAHVNSPSGKDPMHLDLFACETGNMMGETLDLFGAELPAELVGAIKTRLRKQLFENYIYRHQDLFWTRSGGNWNAVCHQGLLGAAFAAEDDPQMIARLLLIARRYLNVFLEAFGEDGGCAEGPGYWQYGFGWFSFLNEQLETRTDGALSFFAGDERVREIAKYAPRVTLANHHFVNFGDSPRNGALNPALLTYLGRRFDDSLLGAHGYRNYTRLGHTGLNMRGQRTDLLYLTRLFLNVPADHSAERAIEPEDFYFKNLGIVVAHALDARGNRWDFAAKAGNNAEKNNHNDCGNYLLNINGIPLVIEIGAPEYTKDFFSENRYNYLAARTLGHSLPIVNGHEQAAGLQYAAGILNAELAADHVEISIDLTNCYPAEAGAIDLTRSFYLDKRQGRLRVKEFYELAVHESFETSIISEEEIILTERSARIKARGFALLVKPFDETVFAGVQVQEYRDHTGAPRKINRLILKPARLSEQRFVGYELEPAV